MANYLRGNENIIKYQLNNQMAEFKYSVSESLTRAILFDGLVILEQACISFVVVNTIPFLPSYMSATLKNIPYMLGFETLSLSYVGTKITIFTLASFSALTIREILLQKTSTDFEKLASYISAGAIKYYSRGIVFDTVKSCTEITEFQDEQNFKQLNRLIKGGSNFAAYEIYNLSPFSKHSNIAPILIEPLESGFAGLFYGSLVSLNFQLFYSHLNNSIYDAISWLEC